MLDVKTPRFSFKYGGTDFSELCAAPAEISRLASDDDRESSEAIYLIENALKVTEHLDAYKKYGAARWVVEFENISAEKTKQISEICDADVGFPFYEGYVPVQPGFKPEPPGCPAVYSVTGSNWARDEYSSHREYLLPNKSRSYGCTGGRSCQGKAPYFDLNQGDKGVIIAVGWTGQWFAKFSSDEHSVRIRTGIENTDFYLEPGEKVRTSSVVMLPYENGQNNGHILFRRLFKEYFSPIGKGERPETAPLCFCAWGSLPSEKMAERIGQFKKHNMRPDYYWIDAGWYGYSTNPCANEHVGDWGAHTGSWVVNKNYHPDGFTDVAAAAKACGLKLLLWFEPERVCKNTDTPAAHPDWFFKTDENNSNLLLNLGNEDALSGTFEMLSGFIEKLNLGCYRQDFNTDPLPFWRKNDAPGRTGLCEIKHINGLYRLWDMLLARFPGLLIDNCASGGRRNDIDMLSRSIPLWRSDYQCTFDADPETAQIHTSGISWWIPYSGTGLGTQIGDKYKIRSAYCSSMAISYWMYDGMDFDPKNQPIDELRECFEEFKSVRAYFSCDYYPLMENSLCDTSWCAWQFDRPEQNDGIIMAFRRPESPMPEAVFNLGGLKDGTVYRFEDADTGARFEIPAEKLKKDGFNVRLPVKRSCCLIRYRTV